MNEKGIIQLSINEEELKKLYLIEVQKHLEKIEMDSILMDSKQLCEMVSLSWPTIEKLFLSDPNFPAIRIGKKWSFNRNAVQKYIDCWFIDVRGKGGMVDL